MSDLRIQPETRKRIHNIHCKEYTFYLHATVVLKQRHQVAVLADLVLDVPHQRADTWFVAAVGVSWHAALQEVLLLRILLQRHKELCHLILLLNAEKETKTSAEDKFTARLFLSMLSRTFLTETDKDKGNSQDR